MNLTLRWGQIAAFSFAAAVLVIPSETVAQGGDSGALASATSGTHWPMRFRLGTADVPNPSLPAAVGSVMLVRSGQVIGTYPIGEGGVAQIPKMQTGDYSIVVNALGGYGAFSAYLNTTTPSVMDGFDINVSLAPATSLPAFQGLLAGASGGSPTSDIDIPTGMVSLASSDAISLSGTGEFSARFIRTIGNTGKGRPLGNYLVALIRNGVVAAQGRTSQDGNVTLDGLSSGRYTLAIIGSNQLLAVSVAANLGASHEGVSVVLPEGEVQTYQVAAFAENGINVGGNPMPTNDFSAATQSQQTPIGSPDDDTTAGGGGIPGGGTGGGSGGGGGGLGGGGGGGLLGALAGAGVGAGVAAAIADDDDGRASSPVK